jgi:hypothetical protein
MFDEAWFDFNRHFRVRVVQNSLCESSIKPILKNVHVKVLQSMYQSLREAQSKSVLAAHTDEPRREGKSDALSV